jgi:AcrR family transcriptional regulator
MPQRGRPRAFDRDDALRRAMRLFWEKGYEGTSMTDLTAAMQIGAPSLYAAFGNKAALFRAAVEIYEAEVGLDIWAALDRAATARQAFRDFLGETARAYARTDQPHGCMIALGTLNCATEALPACEMLRDRRLENARILCDRLERGVRDGDVPGTVDRRQVAEFYATVQHGMSITARDGAGLESLLGTAEAAMAAWDTLVVRRSLD